MTISEIYTLIYTYTDTNSANLFGGDATKARLMVNNAYNRVASLLLKNDKRWKWDDNNQTDLPIATTNLVSGQNDYQLSTSHLKVVRVECADQSGNFRLLDKYDVEDENVAITYLETLSGIPNRYRLLGQSIILDPTPNYNYTAGLKVFFQRGPALFTSSEISTGIKEPGFSSLYHELIPLWVAYNYFVIKDQNKANAIMADITRKEKALIEDVISRDKQDKSIITKKRITFR